MHTQTHASTRIQRWGLIYAQALGRLLMVVCAPACLLAGARARAGGARACVRAQEFKEDMGGKPATAEAVKEQCWKVLNR